MEKASKQNNSIVVSGEIISEPKVKFSTDTYSMCQFKIRVERISGKCDELIIQADEKIIKNRCIQEGEFYKISGDIRTYKNLEPGDGEGKLMVCVSAKVINKVAIKPIISDNECYIKGTLKRKRELKRSLDGTPIREFVLEIKRDKYNKVCFIPCVSWRDNADIVSELEDGSEIACSGRLESRNYVNSAGKHMVCYEVAVRSIDKVEE